jgi:hypothetical protein
VATALAPLPLLAGLSPAKPTASGEGDGLPSAEEVGRFRREGFVLLPGFYDRARDIEPIQRGVHAVIALVRARHGLPPVGGAFAPDTFDAGYLDLIARDRAWGGEVYDAVKQIPAFVRLAADARNEALFRLLRGTEAPGLAAGGYGIRIDNPHEERYRADWHQEYHAQLRSPDGITFWTSLVPVTAEMGPVRFCVGSHEGGLRRVRMRDPRRPEKTAAYGVTLEDRDRLVARYPQVAPLAQPGDLVLIDFAVLHASGYNRGGRARWSLQARYFNFADPTGVRIGWRGSFAAGEDLRRIHPELVVADEADAGDRSGEGT